MSFNLDHLSSFIFTFPIFLFSLCLHELFHAITAKWGGDLTSAYQGRITLNPIAHIDPFGTILMPLLMAISTGIPLIGWAKPVPVVETNYRRGGGYGVIVALAGPFSNLLLAFLGGILLQIYAITVLVLARNGAAIPENVDFAIGRAIRYTISLNLLLMVFNLMPIPPLDGSHVLWHWLVKRRPEWHEAWFAYSRFGFWILISFIAFGAFGMVYQVLVDPAIQLIQNLAIFLLGIFV